MNNASRNAVTSRARNAPRVHREENIRTERPYRLAPRYQPLHALLNCLGSQQLSAGA